MVKKKVLLAANDSTYVYNLRKEILKELIKKGYEVIVVAYLERYVKEIESLGCKFLEINFSRNGTNPFSDINLIKEIYKLLKNEKPDFVLSYNIKPNIYFGFCCSKLNIKVAANITGLGTIQNSGFVPKLARKMYKFGIKNNDVVFFQNKQNLNFFRDKEIIGDKTETILIPGSGINLNEYISKPYTNNNKIVFLSIFRILRDKGINELLESITNIKRKYPDTLFYIAGSYDDINYKQKMDNMENKNMLKYLGFRDDIKQLLSKSNCIIHPSYHEGLSNVLLQAGATGRPVIASNVPGCKETFIDGVSGYSVKARDSDDLTEKIEKFINLPHEDKAKMGLANRKHVEENFDRKIVVEKYLQCIEKYTN